MSKTIETIQGRVRRTELFYNDSTDLYMAIGRTSAWVDENDPPSPTGEETNVEEIIGFKKVDQEILVVQDSVGGTLNFRGQKWRELPVGDIYTEECHWIYVSASLYGDSLPLDTFRQIGLYSGLTPHQDYVGNDYLLPYQVEDRGVLEIIGNRVPAQRSADQTDKPVIILEF
jgi:hypothetical protein